MTEYRYPNETITLAITILLIGGVLLLSGVATVCLVPLLVILVVVLAYTGGRQHHAQLMRVAQPVTPETAPGLTAVAEHCARTLQPGPVALYVVPSRTVNAYTFGLSKPNVIVLHSALVQVMDADEMRFVIGHEMGHIALGHTWLNTLVGGMAGVPMPIGAAVVLTFAFRWWNRACEYSCDRAGLIACGSLRKATSALVQLVVGDINTDEELRRALAAIQAQDDGALGSLGELLATHPTIAKRLDMLRKYAESAEYRRLAGG